MYEFVLGLFVFFVVLRREDREVCEFFGWMMLVFEFRFRVFGCW